MTAAERTGKTDTGVRGGGAFGWMKTRRTQLGIVALLLLFTALALAVTSPALRGWDAHASRETQEHTNPILLSVARGLTNLGQFYGLIALAIPLGAWLYREGRRFAALFLSLTIFGHLFSVWIKLLFHRPRPGALDDVQVFYPAGGTSFPSGHAMAATMFFGFLAFVLMLAVREKPRRYALVAAALLVGTGICWSRVYVGAHFLSDVIGGIVAGLAFLLAFIAAYKHFGAQEISAGASNTVVQ